MLAAIPSCKRAVHSLMQTREATPPILGHAMRGQLNALHIAHLS
jgi:hypothetical protein